MNGSEAPWPGGVGFPEPEPPEGAVLALPAAPLRQVVGTYIARDGAAVPEAARALGLEPDYVLGVLDGTIGAIDARTVRRLSDRLDLAPEDIWGGELGAAIGWVYGPLSPADLLRAPPPPAEPTYPSVAWPEPPGIDL